MVPARAFLELTSKIDERRQMKVNTWTCPLRMTTHRDPDSALQYEHVRVNRKVSDLCLRWATIRRILADRQTAILTCAFFMFVSITAELAARSREIRLATMLTCNAVVILEKAVGSKWF